MPFFTKLSSVIVKITKFLSKNTAKLTKYAIIAETATGNIELIPLTTIVGSAVEEGSTIIANNGIDITTLTQAAVIAENASGNSELVKTTETVGNVAATVISTITKKNS